MATHSSTLVWKIPQTEKPGGPQSVRSQKIWKQLSTHAVSEVAPRHICLFCPQEANYLVQFTLRADYKVRTPGAGPPPLRPARLMGRGEGLGKGWERGHTLFLHHTSQAPRETPGTFVQNISRAPLGAGAGQGGSPLSPLSSSEHPGRVLLSPE